ncbi:hypothetical protein AYO20_09570 [Fonsecaea nubica]|uniref:Cellobiose dehydrogenase-like cytochrome domain-containing protein n=1 Tax=Fonsecaea nubica TaxID=856822 RepID=A0A178CHF5_9EURO|nr:hypothetical protein AYO20_09570 [Fonsecaea nubica]OAL28151.1 hypothetical protein AYO20_09570 [Fonsecaea nubica]
MLFSFGTPLQRQRRHALRPHGLLLALLTLTSGAGAQDEDEPTSSVAQASEPFTDPLTALPMQRFFGARTQFAFSMALSTAATTTTSFIGQLSFPLVGGAGWGAFGLTGEMEGNFILAVWPDGAGGVMASFRQAIDEDNPAEVRGNFAVRPIANAVSVSDTQLTYTFLCEECLNSSLGLGPEATVANAVMGWALSERAVRDPGNPAAFLGFHERGFGPFTARLGDARTAAFEGVAATAGLPVADSGNAVPAQTNIFDGEGSGDEGGSGDDDDDDDDDDDFFGVAASTGAGVPATGANIGSGAAASGNNNQGGAGDDNADDSDDSDDDD